MVTLFIIVKKSLKSNPVYRKEHTMPRAIIYFYSGTNNTAIAAQMIQSELQNKGYEVDLFQVRKPLDKIPAPISYDVLGLGYPIHAFNPPQLFLSTIKRILPTAHNKPVFIFKTAGEPFCLNNASSWSLMRLLKKRGYRLLMDTHLLMPYNILFRYPFALAKQMYVHTRKMAMVIANDIANNKVTKRKIYPWTWLVMITIRYVLYWGARINGPLFHVKKDRCLQCGLCQKLCPSSNIKFKNGYPRFFFDCSMCMACTMYCPTDAIRPGVISWMRVSGGYPFQELHNDPQVPSEYINKKTKGYFKSFRSYYEKTQKLIDDSTGNYIQR
jgi:ferredoxin/flavodoxin